MYSEFDHSSKPILDMLKRCVSEDKVSFHMPGHNNGLGFSEWLQENALKIDTTEFELTDDLNDPVKAFQQAEILAADAFGAGNTFFVTAGASIAIHASVTALAAHGDLLIADRIAHSSLINACRSYGIAVIFGFKNEIPELISSHPEAAAVFVTRPDYYGQAEDIREIIYSASVRKIPVIVDEAHGSHFAFAPDIMPYTALSEGADIVIHSAHKTLPVLTQGAYLHVSGKFSGSYPDIREILRNALKAVSTTSPSFLIAATLDYARSLMVSQGHSLSVRSYDLIKGFIEMLPEELKQSVISSPGSPGTDTAGIIHDPFRICIKPGKAQIVIGSLCEELHRNGIYPEFSDKTDVVLLCKFSNTAKDFKALADVLNSVYLKHISDNDLRKKSLDDYNAGIVAQRKIQDLMSLSCSVILYPGDHPLSDKSSEYRPLVLSAGYSVCEPCAVYPPGIPLLLPGQTITSDVIDLTASILSDFTEINGIRKGAGISSESTRYLIRCCSGSV